jgi:hypothetical protein
MRENCEGCPKLDNCQILCDDINEKMEKVFRSNQWSSEKAVSQWGQPKQKESDDEDEPSIDDFRKIDPGRAFEDVSPNEIEWEQTPLQGKSADLQESEKQLLYDVIRLSIQREKTKLNRRFRDFLKCEKISRIADRAGTTKQNVQKQFQGVIKKACQILKKRKAATKKNITPYQFKLKLY